MPKLSFSTDPIDFLVERRFPFIRDTGPPHYQEIDGIPRRVGTREEIEAYREELEVLPAAEIASRYETEKLKAHQERMAKSEAQELARFFHQPDAEANLDYWSKAAFWKLDEAVLLSLGKEPRVVTWERMERYARISDFVAKFVELRQLAYRAKATHALYESCPPGLFLGWAKRNDIAYPEELERLLVARGNHISNWKAAYDTLKAKVDAEYQERDAKIEALMQQAEELRQKVRSAAELSAQNVDEAKDALKTREKNTLLKLILGMAIAYHGFDPKSSRSSTAREIAGELTRVNLPLDEDTIRKWLREAVEELPEAITE